jgi:hypothetical protein
VSTAASANCHHAVAVKKTTVDAMRTIAAVM